MAKSVSTQKSPDQPSDESLEVILKKLPTGAYVFLVGVLLCITAAWLFRYDMDVAVAPATTAIGRLARAGDIKVVVLDRWNGRVKAAKALNF